MPAMIRCRIAVAALVLALAPAQMARAADVVVFAAASLKNALDDAAHAFEQQGGAPVKISYAASSQLAKQIESGAPADIFISADLAWMDYLQKRNLVQPATRKNLLGNRLVLVAPAGSGVKVEIKPGFDLVAMLKGGRLAMADPASVPAGKYGKAALQKLGVWESVAPHIAGAENVRAALLFVDRKETPLGVVYATDAASDPKVEIAAVFPEDSHPPIIYPVALTATSNNPEAAKFLAFLESPAAKPAFAKQGFTVLGEAR
ncbi:MAG TPA: molybdate ABC transporter substrate-binding protein [Stellaceae bacterium]|nr:molybdate ABC transporter substrate-binding protein [Stellaceae bacterium]